MAEFWGEKWNESWIGCGFYVTKKRFVVTRNHTPFFVNGLVFFSHFSVNVLSVCSDISLPFIWQAFLSFVSSDCIGLKSNFPQGNLIFLFDFDHCHPSACIFHKDLFSCQRSNFSFLLPQLPNGQIGRYFSLGFSDCMQDCHC